MKQWGWWDRLIGEADADTLQVDCLQILLTPWFSIRTNRWYMAELTPDPHDHGWCFRRKTRRRPGNDRRPVAFISFMLRGGYQETIYDDLSNLASCRVRRHNRGSVHLFRHGEAHRITEAWGNCRTIIITGPDDPDGYGYWTKNGRIRWQDYEHAFGAGVTERTDSSGDAAIVEPDREGAELPERI
jgi:hypothetical protein